MGKIRNCELGQKFGDWEVIDPTPIIKNKLRYVTVKCTLCGTIAERRISDLYTGRTSRCKKCVAKPRRLDVKVGDKSKHWTVIEDIKKRDNGLYLLVVQCDCGRVREMSSSEFLDPNSCFQCPSCAQKENQAKLTLLNGRVGELTKNRHTKIKKGAEARNIEFNVSIEYLWNLFIQQNKTCAITGDPLEHLDDASLDRIDSNKGYIEGNVQWVTKQANLSKHIMSMNELYEFCQKVLNHANQQPSTPLIKCEGSETNN